MRRNPIISFCPGAGGEAGAFHSIHLNLETLRNHLQLALGDSTEGKVRKKRRTERRGEGMEEREEGEGKEGRERRLDWGGRTTSPFFPGTRKHARNQVQVVTSQGQHRFCSFGHTSPQIPLVLRAVWTGHSSACRDLTVAPHDVAVQIGLFLRTGVGSMLISQY